MFLIPDAYPQQSGGSHRVTQLQELTADELSPEDCFLVSDVWDKNAGGSVSKRITIAELVKYTLKQWQDDIYSRVDWSGNEKRA